MTRPTLPPAPPPPGVLLVALPGLDGTGRLFEPFVSAWEPRALEIIDFPRDAALDYDALVEHVLPRLPRQRSFVLLAESFSGPLAARLAARQPRGLRGIVFAASFVRAPIPMSGLARRFAGWLPLASMPRATLKAALLSRDSSSDLVEALEQAVRSVRPEVLALRLHSVLASDERAQFAKLQLPLLCLSARDDRLVSKSAADDLRHSSYAGRMDVQEINGPHMLLQTRPVECAKAIAQFLRFLPPTPAPQVGPAS